MNFVKLQGAGNDFVLIDARSEEQDWAKLSRAMCCRHFGIGADGLLLVCASKIADFKMRMFNPDGSEAEACGNGLRCFVKYLMDSGLAKGPELTIETMAGVRKARAIFADKKVAHIQVGMGIPRFRPEEIPVSIKKEQSDYPMAIGKRELPLNFVSMGNPHAVCFLEEPIEDFPLAEIGTKVEHHPLFIQRTNFEIANVLDRHQIKARVWERGAGETLACGSGACAIAVVACQKGLAGNRVNIILPGGILTVDWDGKGEVLLGGPAETVFTGEWIEKE